MASIRTAHASDSEEIARLTSQLGYEVNPLQAAERLSHILSRPNHTVLVAEGGQVIGWVHASAEIGLETGAFVRIGGLVVDQRYRGQGVGRTLMAQVEEWAKHQGCAVVRLWSSAGRTAAHGFYERVGYTNIKTQHSFVKVLADGENDLGRFVPRM